MHSNLASPGYNSAMMSIRSQHDPCHSLPGTPMGIDPRNLGSMDIAAAMSHARMGLENQDYFSGGPRFGSSLRPSSPYPGYEIENNCLTGHSLSQESTPTNLAVIVTRTNLAATLANAQISASAKYGKIFPHVCDDGRYPPDFNMPKTLLTMSSLDNSQLDRIMQSYQLPFDLSCLPPTSGRSSPYANGKVAPISSSRARLAKLNTLWEFLGVWKLVDCDQIRRRGVY